MLTKEELPACPVATTLHLIGNKWKVLILRDLAEGPKRNGELMRSLDGISQKVLTENLRAMENDGLLIRIDHQENPPKVEYEISELGRSMQPILDVMSDWGTTYQELVRSSS